MGERLPLLYLGGTRNDIWNGSGTTDREIRTITGRDRNENAPILFGLTSHDKTQNELVRKKMNVRALHGKLRKARLRRKGHASRKEKIEKPCT